jgi:hypothetical protein
VATTIQKGPTDILSRASLLVDITDITDTCRSLIKGHKNPTALRSRVALLTTTSRPDGNGKYIYCHSVLVLYQLTGREARQAENLQCHSATCARNNSARDDSARDDSARDDVQKLDLEFKKSRDAWISAVIDSSEIDV